MTLPLWISPKSVSSVTFAAPSSPASIARRRTVASAAAVYEAVVLSSGEGDSGAAALELINAKPCDVVLLDVRMPGMDGILLANIIMKTWPAIKVVLSTGAAAVLERQLPANTDVIAKPWRISEMLRLFKGV